MKSSRMTSGVIRSAERMTYTNVNKVIEGDPEMSKRYASLSPRFRDMKELALLLNARRNEHGPLILIYQNRSSNSTKSSA